MDSVSISTKGVVNDINSSEVSVAMITRSQDRKAVLNVDGRPATNVRRGVTDGIVQSRERAPERSAEGVHSEEQSRTTAFSGRAREGGLGKEGRSETKNGIGEVNLEDLSDRDDDAISTDGGSDTDDAYGGQSEATCGGVEDKTRGAGRIRQAAAVWPTGG